LFLLYVSIQTTSVSNDKIFCLFCMYQYKRPAFHVIKFFVSFVSIQTISISRDKIFCLLFFHNTHQYKRISRDKIFCFFCNNTNDQHFTW